MELLSACYYQQGKNEVSLLLQKYRYRQVQILFTCICAGTGTNAGRAGGYMSEQILQWFRELHFKKVFRNPVKSMDRLEESLYEVIQRTDGELENSHIMGKDKKVDLAGIFCIENRYVMLCRGAGRICLVNTAFGRVHIQHMHIRHMHMEGKEGAMVMEQGILQPDIAVLFSMESFYQYVTEEMIRDGLAVREVVTEEQMDRHMRELGKEGERLGGVDMGAVLLRTR